MHFDPTIAAAEEVATEKDQMILCSDEIDDYVVQDGETIDGYDTRQADYAFESMEDSRYDYFR